MEKVNNKLRRLFIVLSILAVLSSVTGGYFYYSTLSKSSEDLAHKEAEEQLRELGNTMDSYLTWSLLSVKSLAGLEELKHALQKTDAAALDGTNAVLDHFCETLKVSVCYLLDSSGNTIASSNRDAPDTFVGKNYGFRPYFTQSMQGMPAVYMALGVTSQLKGIYYSYPVYGEKDQKPLGVAVIKAPIDPIEKDLIKSGHGIVLLTDPHGVVFVSSRRDWLYHVLWKTSPEEISKVAGTRQFGTGPWNWTGVKLTDEENAVDDSGNKYRVHRQALAAYPGWQLVYLHSHYEVMEKITAPLRKSVGAGVVVLCVFFGLIVCFLYIRANTSIVQRAKTEEALKKSREELKSIFRAAPTGIGLVCDRVITQVNDRVCEMTGYARDELIGQNARIFYPSDQEYETLGREKYDQIKEQGTGTVETRFKRKTGEIINVLMSSTPLDTTNISAGVTFTALDITERKRSEEALLREKAFTETALNSQQDTFFLFEVTGKRAVRWNQAFIEISGYTHEEIAKMPAPDAYYTPKDLTRNAATVKEALATGSGRIELDLVCKDGHTVPTEYSVSLVRDDEGNSRYLIYIGRDITQRRQAEDEKQKLEGRLRQALKMEAVGTLSGGIAHDFNNILGIIMGNTEMAFEDVPDWNPAKQNLDEIKTACLRARDVVRQLLSFSRKAEQLKEPTRINDIVSESMKLLRASIPTTIEIDLNLSEKNDTILADSTQIHQVLINLCTNAAHAMEEKGGILKIDVSRVQLNQENSSGYGEVNPGIYVQVAVADTGCGIAPWVQKKMFDPYYTTKDVGKGTGLGLAVVHGIVKNHNGVISVDSRPGKGTCIRVLFPLTDEALMTEETLPQEPLTGNEKILFIDDEISLARLGSEMLKRLGYTIEAKTDPKEALALFHRDPDRFDLIITDMTMPGLTGDKLAKEILDMAPDMPIILCTGYSEKVNKETILGMGIKRYIEKPLNLQELAGAIREVLDEN